jgi:SAM-dependent methyltransferase
MGFVTCHPMLRGRWIRGCGKVIGVPEATHPYDQHVGRYGGQLATHLISLAGLRPRDRVLDVGCGTGQLAAKLAATVGGENVAALDPSAAVVEVCRTRVPAADVRVGSAEALPFADAEFDAVFAQLVINLVDDPLAALEEMVRVAGPGAPLVACVWDDEEMPLLRSFWDAARTAAPTAIAEVSDSAQVGLSDPTVLRGWWEAAGLEEVALGEFEVTADYSDFDDLWHPFEAGVGHSGHLYTSLDLEQQAKARADAHRRLGSPDGPFRLVARVRSVYGVRPIAQR